ncbi:phage tail protein [Salmonella enterica]|nr:phage tail protein [Salmonella enterica]
MSRFTTPAILEMLGHYNWRVHEPFAFYLSDDESDVIEVPAGFVTDLATVPRIFWILLPPDGKYAKAAIIHDYLYDNALRTKKEADLIFLDGMTILGVPKWKRIIMYYAVRLFGRGMYGG